VAFLVVAATGDSSFLAAAFLVAAGFAVSAPASGFASFTGPEGPMGGDYVSNGNNSDSMIMVQRDDKYMSRRAISEDQRL